MNITRKGYIEVFKGTEYISRHVSDWEAIESIARNGEGKFTVTFPNIEVVVDDGDDYSPYQGDGNLHTELFNVSIGVTNGTTTATTDVG